MAIIYSPSVKSARMSAVLARMDGGVGVGGARLEIGTAGMAVVLAVIELATPSGVVTGTTLTLSGLPRSDVSADATGTAASARVRDNANNDLITGLTVTAVGAGGDIQMDSLDVTIGQEIKCTAAAMTHG